MKLFALMAVIDSAHKGKKGPKEFCPLYDYFILAGGF
jgi:hypothetical protein